MSQAILIENPPFIQETNTQIVEENAPQTSNTNIFKLNSKFYSIFGPRLPPLFWSILGYGLSLWSIINYNRTIIITIAIFYAGYNMLNLFFDTFTISQEIDCNNEKFYINLPLYGELNILDFLMVTNIKRFNCDSIEKEDKLNEKFKRIILRGQRINNRFQQTTWPDQRIVIVFSQYLGNVYYLKHIFYIIYVTGLTNKNFIRDGIIGEHSIGATNGSGPE